MLLYVAVLSVPVPNLSFNVGAVSFVIVFIFSSALLYISSLKSTFIVILFSSPYLFVSPSAISESYLKSGAIAVIPTIFGASESAIIVSPVNSLLVTFDSFPATSFTVPLNPFILNVPVSPSVTVYVYVI